MTVLGVALSNGLFALSAALLAQYQGFADVQMGIGMVVWDSQALSSAKPWLAREVWDWRSRAPSWDRFSSPAGRHRLALGALDPNDLKLITAAFVFAALVLPRILSKFEKRPGALKPVAGAQPESVLNA